MSNPALHANDITVLRALSQISLHHGQNPTHTYSSVQEVQKELHSHGQGIVIHKVLDRLVELGLAAHHHPDTGGYEPERFSLTADGVKALGAFRTAAVRDFAG